MGGVVPFAGGRANHSPDTAGKPLAATLNSCSLRKFCPLPFWLVSSPAALRQRIRLGQVARCAAAAAAATRDTRTYLQTALSEAETAASFLPATVSARADRSKR